MVDVRLTRVLRLKFKIELGEKVLVNGTGCRANRLGEGESAMCSVSVRSSLDLATFRKNINRDLGIGRPI